MRRFGRFWYDFVVGDDWRIAGGVVIGLTLTAVIAHQGWSGWWCCPCWSPSCWPVRSPSKCAGSPGTRRPIRPTAP